MTKRYGALVGATKQNFISGVGGLVDSYFERNNVALLVLDTITLAAAPVADTIQAIVGLGWESMLLPASCKIWNGALGAGVLLSLGDITYPNALINAQAASGAGSTLTGLSNVSIASYGQPLWAMLGYASLAAAKAVGPQAELIFTISGAAATGVLTWEFSGIRRI